MKIDMGDGEPRVLFFSDNGHGLGHLTRLSAVAKQARGRFQPVFLTMSLGYPLLRAAGFPVEYFPSYSELGLTKREWSPLLAARTAEVLQATEARVIVVDHVMPPDSFRRLKQAASGVRIVWCRRGLWRAGRNADYLRMVEDFHAVVEPGDLASPIDRGLTVLQRHAVKKVSPVVSVQPEEYVDRETARRALGIPLEGRAILLQLSDSNRGRVTEQISSIRKVLTTVAGDERIHLFAPVHPLHRVADDRQDDGVLRAPVYPVARFFNAFDGAISLAGYNSFHELIVSGLPVVFVPRDTDSLDDQERRARFADLCGRGFWIESFDDPSFADVVRRMLRPEEKRAAAEISRALGRMTGAEEFADFIAELIHEARSEAFTVLELGGAAATQEALAAKLASGTVEGGDGTVTPVAVAAAAFTSEELEATASEMERWQRSDPSLRPVFLIGSAPADPLRKRQFLFETALTEQELEEASPGRSYDDYIRERVRGLVRRYGALEVVPEAAVDYQTRALLSSGPVSQDQPGSIRSFSLRLPASNDVRKTLTIEAPAELYVPRKLQESGFGGYERSSLACWLAVLDLDREGAAFDVGANAGPYAWLAAALTDRTVVAFEPVPILADTCEAIARRNDLDIRVERVALSDHSGSAPLYLSDRTDSSNSLVAGFRGSSQSIQVRLLTLDEFVEQAGTPPHVIKIDTETNEPEVLAGSASVVSKYRPWLIVEVLAGRTEDRLMQVMSPFEYFWYPIGDSVPFDLSTEIKGDPTYYNTNWLLAPDVPDERFWRSISRWMDRLQKCSTDH